MKFDRISDDLPMKKLNTVIPILLHFYSFVSNWSIANRIKPYIIQRNDDAKTISDSILQDILLQNFDVIQSDVAIQNQVH